MIQKNQLSKFLVSPEVFTPSNYEPGGREFETSGTTSGHALPITPSWTDSRPRIWSRALKHQSLQVFGQ